MTSEPLPHLADDDIHVWHTPWAGGAGEDRFAALLAAYQPAAAKIVRGPHGKPHFVPPHDTLGFSWSHSADTAVLAVGRGPSGFELGVDVEKRRPRGRALELARRFFAPDEAAMLETLDDAERLSIFLTLWTAKEAVLKAHGGGLSYGLHRVAFHLDAGRAVAGHFDGEIGPAGAWTVMPLELGEDRFGAVAWRGPSRTLRVFTSSL